MIQITSGRQLKEVREELGINRSQFARLCGRDRSSIDRYETGVLPPIPAVTRYLEMLYEAVRPLQLRRAELETELAEIKVRLNHLLGPREIEGASPDNSEAA
jgi:transcriptional regulator with XRE-family HTH domain